MALHKVSSNSIGGLWQAFLRPLPGDDLFDGDWPHRAYRAQMNAFECVESCALFAPAVIAIQVSGAVFDGRNETYIFGRKGRIPGSINLPAGV